MGLSGPQPTSLILPEATSGVGTITYSLSTTLPDGVTFTPGTRVLAGTPTGRFASATFTYTATDTDSNTDELTFTIVVTATAITFSPASFANQSWTIGTAVALTLPAGAGGVGDLTPTLTPYITHRRDLHGKHKSLWREIPQQSLHWRRLLIQ